MVPRDRENGKYPAAMEIPIWCEPVVQRERCNLKSRRGGRRGLELRWERKHRFSPPPFPLCEVDFGLRAVRDVKYLRLRGNKEWKGDRCR